MTLTERVILAIPLFIAIITLGLALGAVTVSVNEPAEADAPVEQEQPVVIAGHSQPVDGGVFDFDGEPLPEGTIYVEGSFEVDGSASFPGDRREP